MYIYKLIAQNAHYFTFFFFARRILSQCMFSKEFSWFKVHSVIFFPTTTCSQEKPIPINSLIETTSRFEEQCTIHEQIACRQIFFQNNPSDEDLWRYTIWNNYYNYRRSIGYIFLNSYLDQCGIEKYRLLLLQACLKTH